MQRGTTTRRVISKLNVGGIQRSSTIFLRVLKTGFARILEPPRPDQSALCDANEPKQLTEPHAHMPSIHPNKQTRGKNKPFCTHAYTRLHGWTAFACMQRVNSHYLPFSAPDFLATPAYAAWERPSHLHPCSLSWVISRCGHEGICNLKRLYISLGLSWEGGVGNVAAMESSRG